MGKMVLVEHLGERVDVHIESLIRQEKIRYGDSIMLKFCRKQLKMESSFNLVLVSNLISPNFDVNITNHVTLVNFNVTIEGLSQNLLTLIVGNERKDLDDIYQDSSHVTFDNIKILKATENSILERLNE